MSTATPSTGKPKTEARPAKRVLWVIVFVLLATGLAVALAQFAKARAQTAALSADLAQAQARSRLLQMELHLARATLEARHGDYATARQSLTNFFGRLSSEMNRGSGSAFSEDAFYDLQPLLDEREPLLGLLSHSDPASADKLTSDYFVFRGVLPAPAKATASAETPAGVTPQAGTKPAPK